MHKKQEITLSIPQPCKQDWNKMSIAEQGKHCISCNKTVIDFSLYSDKELLEFFSKFDNHVCGRFNDYQLNRTLSIPEQKRFSSFYKLFLGTALAGWLGLLFSSPAKGSNPVQVEQQAKGKKQVASPKDSLKQCIYGLVISYNDKSKIAYAGVYIKEAPECKTTSDINGRYSLRIPDSLIGKKITIIIAVPEYTSAEFTFVANKNAVYKKFRLEYSPYEGKLMGAPAMIPRDTAKTK
jgi:hypothetical protein